MSRRILFTYIVAFVMLILGCLIYLFFRDAVIFTSWLSEHFGLEMPNYGHIINGNTFLGGIFLYSLADALWYGSMLLFERPLRTDNWASRVMTIMIVFLPFILEFLQYTGVISGTFDWNDIIIYLLTLITFLLCSRNLYSNC